MNTIQYILLILTLKSLFSKSFTDELIEHNIYKTIIKNYERDLRPSAGNITLDLKLNQIINLNERSQIMTSSVYIFLVWSDDRLKWNSSEAGMAENSILLPVKDIWLPDLFVLNTADYTGFINFQQNILALITSNGTVSVSICVNALNTRCDTDITRWPFDIQSCDIILGNWQNDASRINYDILNTPIGLDDYIPNPIWDLINTNKSNIPTNSRFLDKHQYGDDIQYTITLKRRPTVYILNNIFPCLILNVVIQLAFFMPFAQKIAISESNHK
jgi:nicotinic acetylcholine receptor